jgi:hypothetical protein
MSVETWDLVFYVDDECQEEWKRVKALNKEQRKVLSSIMLAQAGYCFHWKKNKTDAKEPTSERPQP